MKKIKFYLPLVLCVFIHVTSFAQGRKMGKVSNAVLSEISGITANSKHDGYFWVHNDSGDKAQIYLIDSLAKLQVTVKLDGIAVVDCEDIATVLIDGVPHILLADIGNNIKNREILSLYLFPEPIIDFQSDEIHVAADKIKKIDIKYKDQRRDAEAIFVDQQNQEVYIISKRDFKATVFSFPLSAIGKQEVIILEPQLKLPFTFVTSADMSLNGKYILIKNLTNVYLWERSLGESVLQTLSKPFKQMPYAVEPQGEAICFDKKAPFYYTISERPLGLDSYLYQYNY